MPDDVKFTIGADSDKAVAALREVNAEQAKVIADMRASARESQQKSQANLEAVRNELDGEKQFRMAAAELETRLAQQRDARSVRFTEEELTRQAQVTAANTKQAKQMEDDHTRALGNIQGAAVQVLGALGIGVGIGAAVSTIVRLTKDWYEGMMKVADAVHDAAGDYVALAGMQQPGEARGGVQQAGLLAARYGKAPGVGARVVMEMQTRTGSLDKGLAAGEVVLQMMEAGATQDAATQAVSMGLAHGLTAQEAAAYAYSAGPGRMQQMAEVPAMMQFYGGMKGGERGAYGTAAGLLDVGLDPGQLAQAMRQLPTALGKEKGQAGEFVRSLPGFAEGDIMAMAQGMHDRGVTSVEAMEKHGIASARELNALLLLAQHPDQARAAAERSLDAAQNPVLLGQMLGGAANAFPELQGTRAEDILTAWTHLELTTPTTKAGQLTAGQASHEKRLAQARALALAETGYGTHANLEGMSGFEFWRAQQIWVGDAPPTQEAIERAYGGARPRWRTRAGWDEMKDVQDVMVNRLANEPESVLQAELQKISDATAATARAAEATAQAVRAMHRDQGVNYAPAGPER